MNGIRVGYFSDLHLEFEVRREFVGDEGWLALRDVRRACPGHPEIGPYLGELKGGIDLLVVAGDTLPGTIGVAYLHCVPAVPGAQGGCSIPRRTSRFMMASLLRSGRRSGSPVTSAAAGKPRRLMSEVCYFFRTRRVGDVEMVGASRLVLGIPVRSNFPQVGLTPCSARSCHTA